jgi:hypothetical protein
MRHGFLTARLSRELDPRGTWCGLDRLSTNFFSLTPLAMNAVLTPFVSRRRVPTDLVCVDRQCAHLGSHVHRTPMGAETAKQHTRHDAAVSSPRRGDARNSVAATGHPSMDNPRRARQVPGTTPTSGVAGRGAASRGRGGNILSNLAQPFVHCRDPPTRTQKTDAIGCPHGSITAAVGSEGEI